MTGHNVGNSETMPQVRMHITTVYLFNRSSLDGLRKTMNSKSSIHYHKISANVLVSPKFPST